MSSDNPFVIDLRTKSEWDRLPSTADVLLNIPPPPLSKSQLIQMEHSLLREVQGLPKDYPIEVFCAKGVRAGIAVDMLIRAGYTNAVSLGGIIDY